MNHRSYVIRNRQLNRYEAICDECGVIATSPTKKGEMEQRAARHEGRPVPAIVRRPRKGQWAIAGQPATKDEWMEYIRRHHLELLGSGAARDTYALDDKRVLKIERAQWGQCEMEVKFWNASSAERRQYLATILSHGKGWVIMERAMMTLRDFGGLSHKVTRAMRDYAQCGDLHDANIGYFPDGRFKVIDYAL